MLKVKSEKVAQSCPALCDLMLCTVHGILQASILEWVAFPFSRGFGAFLISLNFPRYMAGRIPPFLAGFEA